MTYKICLATVLLSAALIGAPGLSGVAYAHEHDGWNKTRHSEECHHGHLSETQKKLIHETMHKLHESDKADFEEMHKLHKNLHQVLTAKTFNKTEFLSLREQIASKRGQIKKRHAEAFASIADQFTPEERKHLIRLFAHHRHGHHMQHGHRHGMKQGDWEHHEGHEGAWEHHEGHDDGAHDDNHAHHQDDGMNGNESPATIGQAPHNGDFPPASPR